MNLKRIASLMVLVVLIFGLVACNQNGAKENEKPAEEPATVETAEETTEETTEEPTDESPESDFDTSANIDVISREDGSGTRGAFVEITGVESDGNDNTTVDAIIQNSTNGVMTTVSGDTTGIGYISLGSLNETVKAVQVEGVETTANTVKSGDYPVARPFNVAWKAENIGEIGEDLMRFIQSPEGQAVVEEAGFVSVETEEDYEPAGLSGQITVGGSTSVTPVMEKLVEAYQVHNPDVQVDIQSTGSSAGMTAVIEGQANIGMASRELKDEEKAELESCVIAIDGIAVIVHNDNPLETLTMDEIQKIFLGEITTWSEVIK